VYHHDEAFTNVEAEASNLERLLDRQHMVCPAMPDAPDGCYSVYAA
jgi:hypothetical protein